MGVRWMLAALFVLLASASLGIAAEFESLFLWALVVAAFLWLGAVLLAGVLLVPVLLGRRAPPRRLAVGIALALAGLAAFPVDRWYYEDRYWAEQASGVGRCNGIVPLAEALWLDRSELEWAPMAFTFGCDD